MCLIICYTTPIIIFVILLSLTSNSIMVEQYKIKRESKTVKETVRASHNKV